MLRVSCTSTDTAFFIPHTYISKVHNRSVMFRLFKKHSLFPKRKEKNTNAKNILNLLFLLTFL